MKKLSKSLLAENIEARLSSDLEMNNISGASLIVKQAGETVYKNHFGVISPESDIAVSDNTIFRLASMTKPITGVAAMILVDRGLLSLDDNIEKYVPEFSAPFIIDENGVRVSVKEKITVKNLLTHTAGIGSGPTWINSYKLLTARDKSTVDDFVRFIATQPLSYIPGTKSEYSGVATFSIMTYIIEKLTGKDYESFLREEIFVPCEMKDTTFSPSEEQWQRVITMHNKTDGRSVVGNTVSGCVFGDFLPKNPLGGAGLVSTLNDYSNFVDMLSNRGVYKVKRIISDEAFTVMSTPQVSPEVQNGNQRWGISMRVITKEKYERLPVGSFGWSGAYGTHFWVDPVNNVSAIYMKNSQFDGGSGAKTAANFERDVFASFEI